MAPKPLYHYTMCRLQPGSIIEPGNWGRLLRRYQHKAPPGMPLFGNSWTLCRELVLEEIRLKSFQEKPSRMSACFALPSGDAAQWYRSTKDPNYQQVLHEVEIVDPEAPSHTGSLLALEWPTPDLFLDPMRSQAVTYWSGDESKQMEIITASALKVLSIID